MRGARVASRTGVGGRHETGYRPIGDYAIVGDAHTAALVASDGSIDWLCWPRFDSSAVLCRLLDARKGGFLRVGPSGLFASTRSYVGDTNVLATEFETSQGRARVTDFMPVRLLSSTHEGEDIAASNRVLRLVEGLAGDCDVEVAFKATFDFARGEAHWTTFTNGLLAAGRGEALALQCPARFELGDDGVQRATLRVRAGDRVWVSLTYLDGAGAHNALPEVDAETELARTLDYWQGWTGTCRYTGPYANVVRRSALVLKLLTYEPTGAIIAAPTTSLPEAIGGVRNWDYRFTWLRDSALIIYALQLLGYTEEATDFFRWLDHQCIPCAGEELQILYRIDGGLDTTEVELDHLEGYRGSRPVRIGNAAATQKQLDIYGEIIDAAFLYHKKMRVPLSPELWNVIRCLANEAVRRWREPDQGIWEVRGGPRHFLYSKLMCWVAVDRALRLGRKRGVPAELSRWARARTLIRSAILTEGFDSQVGAFTQAFGERALDASALAIPQVGFLPATDRRVVLTVQSIRERLTSHGLVYRYLNDDGVPGSEATFALCTLWLVDCLAEMGRVDEARALFETVLAYGNDVGLFAEELDPTTREVLGNFPQGFTHLGLIRAALNIAKAEAVGPETRAHSLADRSDVLERAAGTPVPGGRVA